jgi:hypothetical protein
MIQRPKFLTGHHAERGLLWASIDSNVHYLKPQVAETRFAGYLAPFTSEDAAREALIAAGAMNIEAEQRSAPQRARRG